MLRQYIEAIADMHDRGVSNPDVNPGGFILEPSGNLKLIDFAEAKFFSDSAQENPSFDGFSEDANQLAAMLSGTFGRTLLGLPISYDDQYKDVDHDDIEMEYLDALMNEDDPDLKAEVEAIEEMVVALKNGDTRPRDLLAYPLFQEQS